MAAISVCRRSSAIDADESSSRPSDSGRPEPSFTAATVCRRPSSKTWKSSAVRPRIGRPSGSLTTV